jgi:APA family basic amino acid/polyamine antiporter
VLGLAFGLAVLVGNTIGMGILRTPGEVAHHLPSAPLFMAVWVLGGVYALLGALTMAELGAMRPRSGGVYPHVRHALGPFLGFVSGWTDWISLCGSIAAVAIVLGEYAGPLVPTLTGREAVIASAVVAGIALLQWNGIRIGDLSQRITSLVKALSLVGLAAVALVLPGGAAPPAVAPSVAALPGGPALAVAVVVALQSAIFTYDGWTGPIYFSEEVQDPGRDIPRAMIGGVVLVLGIYLALNLAFLRVLSIQEMAGDPFVAATAAMRLFGPAADAILRGLMVFSLVASVNALQLMACRVPFAMSRDGLLPSVLCRVNPGGTPVATLLASALLALGFIVTNTFDTVLALLAFFFVANYTLAFTAMFVLRRREPGTARPFRVPAFPWVPGFALAGSLAFLVAQLVSDRTNGATAVALLVLSWPVYAAIGKREKGGPAR